MGKPIYFSKIEFTERIGYRNQKQVILLSLPERELSYQIVKEKRLMPAIQGVEKEVFMGKEYTFDVGHPARFVCDSTTQFKNKLIKCDHFEDQIIFSKGIKLSNKQFEKILPLCNALNFETYRGREMSMSDDGFIGYRDEVHLDFRAITDDVIPMIELPMSYYYDEEHIWPSEKLYMYLILKVFDKHKDMRGLYTEYGGHSLFYRRPTMI